MLPYKKLPQLLLPALLFVFFTGAAAARAQTKPEKASPSSGLTLDQIFVDAKKPTAWNDPVWEINEDHNSSCKENRPSSGHAVSVHDLAGAPVKAIHVTAYQLSPSASKSAESEIRERVLKVWYGQFSGASCGIEWSEAAFWSIKADVEFVDSNRGSLLTYGIHVRLQTHDGNIWYFRLLPAAYSGQGLPRPQERLIVAFSGNTIAL